MKSSVKFGEINIEFNVIYSKRKTLEISIKAPGIVTVRSPHYLSENQIEQSVINKGKWIIEKVHQLSKSDYIPAKREYVYGESFMYLGRSCLLKIIVDENIKKPKVKLDEDELIISTPVKDETIMREAMEIWYKEMAKNMIEERVLYYSRYFNIKANSIKIKAQKTRWGSCNYKNDLFFNYKLIMSPLPVLDYVVVHEMCHMEHKNHQKNFWNRVKSILPDYEKRRLWLKENGMKMDV